MISASWAASSASCGEAQSEPAKRCTCGCEPEITAASDATSPACGGLITGSVGHDVICIRGWTDRKGFNNPQETFECDIYWATYDEEDDTWWRSGRRWTRAAERSSTWPARAAARSGTPW